MVEKILENVINEMIPHLNQGQLEHLSNVLYVNFHGKEIREECTELIPSGMELIVYGRAVKSGKPILQMEPSIICGVICRPGRKRKTWKRSRYLRRWTRL